MKDLKDSDFLPTPTKAQRTEGVLISAYIFLKENLDKI